MPVDKIESAYLLEAKNIIAHRTAEEDNDFNLLGFANGFPVLERDTQPSKVAKMDRPERKLIGKSVILKNSSNHVVLSNKNVEVRLKNAKIDLKSIKKSLNESLNKISKPNKLETDQTNHNLNIDNAKCSDVIPNNNPPVISYSDFESYVENFYRSNLQSPRESTPPQQTDEIELELSESHQQDPEVKLSNPIRTYSRRVTLEEKECTRDHNIKNNEPIESDKKSDSSESKTNEKLVDSNNEMKDTNEKEEKSSETVTKVCLENTNKVHKVVKTKEGRARKQLRRLEKTADRRMRIRREVEECMTRLMRRKQKNRRNKSRRRKPNCEDFSCQTHVETSSVETQTEKWGDSGNKEEVDSDLEDPIIGENADFGVKLQVPTIVNVPDVHDLMRNSGSSPSAFVSLTKDMPFGFPSSGPSFYDKIQFQKVLITCVHTDSSGNLPLHVAVLDDDPIEVKRQCLLLKLRNVSLDITNNMGMTALHLAMTHDCNSVIVEFLLHYGSEVGAIDNEGNNAIHLAITNSVDCDVLKRLLLTADDKLIDSFNYDGFTPLMLCALDDKVEMASILLEHGACPNIRDQKSGRTPLFHAVENNNYDLVKLFINYKADTKIKNYFGTSSHEAVFELESVNPEIKSLIIGKDGAQNKSKATDRKRKFVNLDKDSPQPHRRPVLKTVKTFQKIVIENGTIL